MPECYKQTPPRLKPGYFSKFGQDTLFYIFYSMPADEAQVFAADELSARGWGFNKELKVHRSTFGGLKGGRGGGSFAQVFAADELFARGWGFNK